MAWLFPGQGSQVVGMGRALADAHPAAAAVYAEANRVLGFDLTRLCFEGPQDELDRTVNAQPALLATSIAALRAIEGTGMTAAPVCVAGHSLGEFSALVAAGAFTLADALRLVRHRGELMQAADPSGGMAAVLGLDGDIVARAIESGGYVVANDNAPGQVVISGPRAGFDAVADRLKAAGAKRVVPLRVSAAFHSPALREAAPRLGAAIDALTLHDLRYPVIANVDGRLHREASDFRALLERQVWSPVRWVDAMRCAAAHGVTIFAEFGAGNVLTGLVKRILPDARTTNVSDPATLEEALSVVR